MKNLIVVMCCAILGGCKGLELKTEVTDAGTLASSVVKSDTVAVVTVTSASATVTEIVPANVPASNVGTKTTTETSVKK